jgi:hypothetical protein
LTRKAGILLYITPQPHHFINKNAAIVTALSAGFHRIRGSFRVNIAAVGSMKRVTRGLLKGFFKFMSSN